MSICKECGNDLGTTGCSKGLCVTDKLTPKPKCFMCNSVEHTNPLCNWYVSPSSPKESAPSALDTQVDGNHYKKLAIQPMEYSVKNKLGFAEGNAIKYITRHRDKNGKVDLEKAIHCLQLLMELEYGK